MNNSQIRWTVQYRTITDIMWCIEGAAKNMDQARDNGLEKAAEYLYSKTRWKLSAGELRRRRIFLESIQKGPGHRVSAPKVTERRVSGYLSKEIYVIEDGRPYGTAIVITYFEE